MADTLAPVPLAPIAAPSPLVRAWVVDDRLVLAASFQMPGRQSLEHLEIFLPMAPGPWTEPLQRAAAAAGCRWTMLLFVLGEDGIPVFYDVDCNPVLDGLTAVIGDQVARACALALLSRGEEIDRLPPLLPSYGTPCERPTLFQRRMLSILFDIEATKHRPLASQGLFHHSNRS